MKKLLFFLVIFLISVVVISDVNKFKVTFSITFDQITLEQAAKIEKQLLKQFKNDSCEIKIELSDNCTHLTPECWLENATETLEWWNGNTIKTLEYNTSQFEIDSLVFPNTDTYIIPKLSDLN